MVLCLKTWESRSPPGLQKADMQEHPFFTMTKPKAAARETLAGGFGVILAVHALVR